uniref:Neuromedin U n=1 Tax=Amazona collaria TaxID=241587 RepID=A0A8B9G8W1_9PSIT
MTGVAYIIIQETCVSCTCRGAGIQLEDLCFQTARLCELLQIEDVCSAYLSPDSQPQVSDTLEELCFLIMGFLQKPQVTHTKFLFHYSKTHDSGNSDIMSSVLHPLLQLVPQLNERRLKRYKLDVFIFSRGFFHTPLSPFLFRIQILSTPYIYFCGL